MSKVLFRIPYTDFRQQVYPSKYNTTVLTTNETGEYLESYGDYDNDYLPSEQSELLISKTH